MVGAMATRADTPESPVCPEDLPDNVLLEQFLNGEPLASQDAFRTLVLRHGPAVRAICRRILERHHDVEDASQAAFITLAMKGGAIIERKAFAAWIREVALRIALRTRARASRRRILERRAMEMTAARAEFVDQDHILSLTELRPVVREEVFRLPEKYRSPVMLSYFEGKTNNEVAELLSWPVGTVKGRLSRARQILRSRLSRRGVTLSTAGPSC